MEMEFVLLEELLEMLDGNGLVITDYALIEKALLKNGFSFETQVDYDD